VLVPDGPRTPAVNPAPQEEVVVNDHWLNA
jgi:hypothetical protein